MGILLLAWEFKLHIIDINKSNGDRKAKKDFLIYDNDRIGCVHTKLQRACSYDKQASPRK